MGFLSSIFNGLGSLISGAGSSIGSFLGGGGGSNLLGGISNLFGGGNQQPAVRQASGNTVPFAQQKNPGQFRNSPYVSGGQLPGFASTSKNGNKPKGLLDNIFPGGSTQGMAGLAIPALGNLFAPKSPNIPDLNSLGSVQALSSFRPGNSISPEYKTMLDNNNNRLRDQRVRDLQATYRSARPGTDYLTDTNYQRDLSEIERQVQSQSADDLARAEGTFSSQEQERLSRLAEMDIYSIMAQTGLDAQEANDFKEMFANVGNMFLTGATRKSSPLDMFGA